MKKKVFRGFLLLTILSFFFKLEAQQLTISTGGQTSSPGTNWSISGNTLTVTGTATINPTAITNALATGNLSIVGNISSFAVTINNAITTTTTNGLTIGGTSNTGTITINQAVNISGSLTLIGGVITGSGNIGLAANRSVTLNVGSTSTYSGIISGSTSGLIKAGNGQLTLTNDHTYTGSTVINGGVLRVGSLSSLFVSGTISSTSAVAIASGCKLILSPNENINFAAPISGAGDLEIIGESGEYYSTFLTGTAATMVTNSTVLEVLSRISSGLQQGGAITPSFVQVAGAYHKNYNAASNTATFQLQQYDGQFTKCVFVLLSQSGSNVQIRGNTGIYNTGAAYRSGNTLGVDLSTTGSTSMDFATSSDGAGYGIAKIFMSGKVNLTGALTLTGNIILSNSAVNITSNPNTHAYTSKGTLEITNSSSSLSTSSSIINNGVLIYNSSTALSISTNMSGTGEVIQVGTATTSLTGSNTNSGSTIIASNTTLQIGAGSTTGTYTNNVLNFGTLQFNRSDNSTYAGVISGTGSLTKSGDGNLTLTGLNTFTGTTTISAGKLILERNVPSFSSSSISGNGELVIQPSSASFSNAITYPIAGFTVASSIGGLTIGKPLNASNVSISSATTIAGPISIYGGTVTLSENIASSNGSTISLYANTLNFGLNKTVTSSGQLIVAPQNTASTVGLAGATGTLQLPASYFSLNFTDGFSNIQIGSASHTGNINVNTFTLRDNMSLLTSGALSMGGKPLLGVNNLTIGSGITTITSSTSNYFQTNGTGKVIRTITNAGTFLFPIGNAAYNPLSIKNNTGTSDVFSANVIDAVYLEGTSGTTVSTPVVNRTWDISKANANVGTGVDFEFNWNTGEVSNGTLVAPKMNHYSSTTNNWEVPTVTSTTFTTNKLTVVGYTGSFSPFTVAQGTSALPVELTAFNANCTENATTINWQTASEQQSDYFEVEKSRDGLNWSLLETVAAAGNSTAVLDYSVTDTENATDVVYYRLNQVDQDGVSKIYGPISAQCGEAVDFSVLAFPNPTSGELAIEINNAVAQQVHIQICGTDGKVLVEATYTLEAGTTQLPFNLEMVNAGLYTVKVQGESTTEIIKVVVK